MLISLRLLKQSLNRVPPKNYLKEIFGGAPALAGFICVSKMKSTSRSSHRRDEAYSRIGLTLNTWKSCMIWDPAPETINQLPSNE